MKTILQAFRYRRLRAFVALAVLLLCFSAEADAQYKVRSRRGEVLAHGLRFDPTRVCADMPEALQELLHAYAQRRRYAPRQRGEAIAPLLQSVRGQGEPYNRSTPYYIDEQGQQSQTRTLTGCVATCIEQVLTYYRYPEVLQDTLFGWTTANYSVADVLPGTPIDWDNVLMNYNGPYTDAQAQAVSDLSLYCGMAARMSWGVSSSGASIRRAVEPLRRAFGYETVEYIQRAFYSGEAWNRLLRNELREGRPICYTGHNLDFNGHAFNIDGVDAQGYYHINWGYDGAYDGYYDLDFLNPFESATDPTELGRMVGFFSNQTALLLCPTRVEPLLLDSLSEHTALEGVSVEDFKLRRQPDTQDQSYTVADLTLRNTTDSPLDFTFAVFTNLPTDTAVFAQADYVALSTVSMQAGERLTVPVYCRFMETGDRLLRLTADDSTFLYEMPVQVVAGQDPVLSFDGLVLEQIVKDGRLGAMFRLQATNSATGGVAGRMMYYNLVREGESQRRTHFDVLSLPGGEQDSLSTVFWDLEEGATYTLTVRCRWTDYDSLTFVATRQGATNHLAGVHQPSKDKAFYSLRGFRLKQPVRGLVISNGKKCMIRE